MKKVKLLCVASLISFLSMAQSTTHTIKAGETIGAVAKKYGVGTKQVLDANGLTDKTILKIGQVIKIPKGNAAVTKAQPKVEPKEVITKKEVAIVSNGEKYQIQKGDNLAKIARNHGITDKQLMELNNLKNDNIRAGDFLVVGTKKATTKKEETIAKAEPSKKVEKVNEVTKPTVVEDKPIVNVPAKVELPKKIEVPKKEEVVKVINEEVKPKAADIKRPIETKVEDTKKIVEDIAKLPPTSNANETGKGAFEGQFEGSSTSVEGSCGVFKTISGWHDKKYYVLLDNAQNGSIVKIAANNKFVYAKVLGPLPDVQKDKKYKMRVSNATAAALGVKDDNFTAKVEF